MRDEELIEPFAAQEYFVDGFTDHTVRNGIMSCAGYRLQPSSRTNGEPLKVVVIRLVFPVDGLEEAIASAKKARAEPFVAKALERIGRH